MSFTPTTATALESTGGRTAEEQVSPRRHREQHSRFPQHSIAKGTPLRLGDGTSNEIRVLRQAAHGVMREAKARPPGSATVPGKLHATVISQHAEETRS